MYKRLRKRNSYTIVFNDANGIQKFAFIEYFIHLNTRIVAVLQTLRPLPCTCKEHFELTTNHLDYSSFIVPVSVESTTEFCFVEEICTKCLFLDFGSIKYVVKFPSAMALSYD